MRSKRECLSSTSNSSLKRRRSLIALHLLQTRMAGWYFLGVEDDEHNRAKSVLGIPHEPDPISKVYAIIKSNIDPLPTVYPHLVELGNGKVALAVFIPPEQDGPFITLDGRIYRRNNDSSD